VVLVDFLVEVFSIVVSFRLRRVFFEDFIVAFGLFFDEGFCDFLDFIFNFDVRDICDFISDFAGFNLFTFLNFDVDLVL